MKKLNLVVLLALIVSGIGLYAANPSADIVPKPKELSLGEEMYFIPARLTVSAKDKSASKLASESVEYLRMRGFQADKGGKRPDVLISREAGFGPEQYSLDVNAEGISIVASSDAGVFYAVQTLTQLADASGRKTLPVCRIEDEPRWGYRGLMLDVVRCYIPADEIKKFIDVASRLKINNLHLHLTDDNGWRLEISKYPKLTEVGAWRVERPELFPGRLNQRDPSEPTPVGGFYTRKEMRDLVRYAAERHVNIIPEIEMPAHSAAAIAAYPELACESNHKFVGVFPGIGGSDADIIMCAGNDKVFEFYENVLDEVMEIFPSKYIHLGGDEANKTLWEQCRLCRQRVEDLGLENFEQLQAYFMDRINHYVRSHGRTAIGWDEVTYGNPKEDMVIMGWQADGSVAVRDSEKSGRKFVMTPARVSYLIRYQGPQWFEPWTYFGNNTLSDIHAYEPVKPDWTPQLEDNLLGFQGSLWSEFCTSAEDMQYLVLPRLLAVADVAWREKGAGDSRSFLRGVDNFLPVLDSAGIAYARSMWNIQHTARPLGDGRVEIKLECERPDAQIRYSSGDSTFAVPYDSALVLDADAVIYASTFRDGVKQGRTLRLPVEFNKATGRNVKSESVTNTLLPVLTNGVRGSRRNSDFEWAGWWNTDAAMTVDLGSEQPVREVRAGILVNSDICVAAPRRLYLYAAGDNGRFRYVAEYEMPEDEVYAHPARIIDADFGHLDIEVRYLKVTAAAPGTIPDGMAREGAATWMYFDEITVN